MYQPNLTTLACLVAAALWLAAGLRLFLEGTRQESRPDFVLSLGLIAGGILLGIDCTPLAGQGVFPLAGLMLAGAGFWAFGLGLGDEATGLQRGERGFNIAGAIGSVLALHFAVRLFGAQPALDIGVVLRPFDLLITGLVIYLWTVARRLPRDFFVGMNGDSVRGLLWATAGASLASFFGHRLGDGFAFLLLSVAVAPYLAERVLKRDFEVRRCGAVAAAVVVVALGLSVGDHLARHQSSLQGMQAALADVARQYESLQEPVDESVTNWVAEQPRIRHGARSGAVAERVAHLRDACTGWPVPGLGAAVERIQQALAHHGRWSQTTFQAVEMRHATIGDEPLREEHEDRARTGRREAALALDRGRAGMADLQQAIVAGGAIVTAETHRLRDLLLGVLVTLGLLGAAFLAAARDADDAAIAAEIVDLPEDEETRAEPSAEEAEEEFAEDPLRDALVTVPTGTAELPLRSAIDDE